MTLQKSIAQQCSTYLRIIILKTPTMLSTVTQLEIRKKNHLYSKENKSIVYNTQKICTFNMYDHITPQFKTCVFPKHLKSLSFWPYLTGFLRFFLKLISYHLPLLIHYTSATLAFFLLLECAKPSTYFLFLMLFLDLCVQGLSHIPRETCSTTFTKGQSLHTTQPLLSIRLPCSIFFMVFLLTKMIF